MSDDLTNQFEAAVTQSKSLPSQPNDRLLELYALYKQATVGDVAGKRPGALDMKGRAKYDAWAKKRGTTNDDAKRQYIALVERLG